MDAPTSTPEAIAKVEIRPEHQHPGKEAWVTPVVREYDPVEHTNGFSGSSGADATFYS